MTISYHVVTCPFGWHDHLTLDHLRVKSNHRKLLAAVKRDDREQKQCFNASKLHLGQRVVAQEDNEFRWLNEAERDERSDYWSEQDRAY